MRSYETRNHPPDIELMMAATTWLLQPTAAHAERLRAARAPAAEVPDLDPVRVALAMMDNAGADPVAGSRARRALSEALSSVAARRREANGIRPGRNVVRVLPATQGTADEGVAMDDARPWWQR